MAILNSSAGVLGDFNDMIFGDHGVILQNVEDPNLRPILLQKIQTTSLHTILSIESIEFQKGDDDVIFGGLDRDVIIGGAGDDMLDGDEQDDLIFGDSVFLERRDFEMATPAADDGSLVDDITSPRFQTLIGTLIYSRSDRLSNPNDPNSAPGEDDSGQLLTDGIARNWRDPNGPAWWNEHTIDYAQFHTFPIDEGTEGVGLNGNDYIAGGIDHDQLFGQLGNDIVQGDGGIEDAFAAVERVGASRTPMRVDDPDGPGIDDPVGPLEVIASFETAQDGQDYIEGGGGNDIVFGGLGQDDILGGSSDFYSLNNPDLRPDGDDRIFGGSGIQIDRNNGFSVAANEDVVTVLDGTPFESKHGRDSDAIVGDNGRIVRIVGINSTDVNPTVDPANPLYIEFNYDNYGGEKIVVRGITLLDYTPGGPDFQPDLFSIEDPNDPAFRDEFGLFAQVDIGGHDEVHGETGSVAGAMIGSRAVPALTACSAVTGASLPAATPPILPWPRASTASRRCLWKTRMTGPAKAM